MIATWLRHYIVDTALSNALSWDLDERIADTSMMLSYIPGFRLMTSKQVSEFIDGNRLSLMDAYNSVTDGRIDQPMSAQCAR